MAIFNMPGTSNGYFILVVVVFVAVFAANGRNLPQVSWCSKTPAKTRQNTRKNQQNTRKYAQKRPETSKRPEIPKRQNDQKKEDNGSSRW